MTEAIQNRINQYLEDTIAAERNFESALSSFGKAGVQPEIQQLLSSFSAKAKTQHERLTALLESRGGSPSAAKTMLAEMLAFTPLSAQIGQGAAEKNTQHLMVIFAAASAEMAMYESLVAAATEAGDEKVVSLGRKLQAEEQDDYEHTWTLLKSSAASAFRDEIAKNQHPDQIIVRYLKMQLRPRKASKLSWKGFPKKGTMLLCKISSHNMRGRRRHNISN
jgi:ferritin-like metal-binding protein YciE